MRWPDATHWFTPKPDPIHNLWFLRNPATIAAAKGWGQISPFQISPFYVEQESPVPPGGWPRPGKLVVRLHNDHLQYAITWYGLALEYKTLGRPEDAVATFDKLRAIESLVARYLN